MLLFQIFTPTERIENPLLVNLVFCQIVQDVFSKACIRINKDDRMRMKSYLGKDQIIYIYKGFTSITGLPQSWKKHGIF